MKKNDAPCIVHSDLFYPTMLVIDQKIKKRISIIKAHIDFLEENLETKSIWFPSFNYDFCKGKDYDVKKTPSQAGPLTELIRKKYATWRTLDPVFSFSGLGKSPNIYLDNEMNPFDQKSIFHQLVANKGFVFLYGAKLSTSTLIHYAEHVSQKLIYRYNKIFRGNIINGSKKKLINYTYHVRPSNIDLNYDWNKLEKDLKKENILNSFTVQKKEILHIFDASLFTNFIVKKMKNDPFYLLNISSRKKCEKIYAILNRPFLITDFEKTR
tara:strand:- start:6080 stop:6883 length:804 start_codon:yes stop_codon:yes gene_type:complete